MDAIVARTGFKHTRTHAHAHAYTHAHAHAHAHTHTQSENSQARLSIFSTCLSPPARAVWWSGW